MPANIEVCNLRRERTRIEKYGRPNLLDLVLGGGGEERTYGRWIAEVAHPSGKKIVAQTEEFLEWDTGLAASEHRSRREEDASNQEDARNQLVQQLLNDGWEVMTADDRGVVQSLKRQTGAAPSGGAASPTDLLTQLASLRDAGILTEEEFQVKKAEILRRI